MTPSEYLTFNGVLLGVSIALGIFVQRWKCRPEKYKHLKVDTGVFFEQADDLGGLNCYNSRFDWNVRGTVYKLTCLLHFFGMGFFLVGTIFSAVTNSDQEWGLNSYVGWQVVVQAVVGFLVYIIHLAYTYCGLEKTLKNCCN
jgi:hypothetical protein